MYSGSCSVYLGVPFFGGEARSQPMPRRPVAAAANVVVLAILLSARRNDLLRSGAIGMAEGGY